MSAQSRDPYQTLGVSLGASDKEIRSAYRRLVQLHHPDHNGGSAESERRFEEVQEAYARIRASRGSGLRADPPPPRGSQADSPPPREPFDSDIEARAAALERELRKAHQERERARQAAREAAAAAGGPTKPPRPTDEELGYFETDDSFTKILADAKDELSDRFSGAREHPVVRRVSSLIDELDELASKLTGER
jgi:curved DNA-binding protein CbpA